MEQKQLDISSATMKIEDVYVIIPAKNEVNYIATLLLKLKETGFRHLIVVNDSSTDETKAKAESVEGVIVLDHIINLGPGAATQTGIAYAVSKNAHYIATIDADMQHDPTDLLSLLSALEQEKADLVIGSRFKQQNDIPTSRVFFNKVGNLISYFFTGVYLSDSQSGLKVISGNLAKTMNLNYDGFEFCMEIIKHAHSKKSTIIERPISVLYTTETLKKGQGLISGINMLTRLFSPFS